MLSRPADDSSTQVVRGLCRTAHRAAEGRGHTNDMSVPKTAPAVIDSDAGLERIATLLKRLDSPTVKGRAHRALSAAIQTEAAVYRKALDHAQAAAAHDLPESDGPLLPTIRRRRR